MQTIVMLYGFCGYVNMFAPQKAFFAKTHQVYVPDWFELCKDKINTDENLIKQIASCIIEDLNKRNIKHPILVGHSMGGTIAVNMISALRYKAKSLVILDNTLKIDAPKKQAYDNLAQQYLESNDKKQLIETFFRKKLILKTDDPTIAEEIVKEATTRPDPLWAHAMLSAVNCKLEKLVSELKLDTLYIGSHSPFTTSDVLKTLNPAIRFAHIQQSGHFITLFAATEVNKILRAFIKTV